MPAASRLHAGKLSRCVSASSFTFACACNVNEQIVEFPDANGPRVLRYEEEWLTVMRSTDDLLNLTRQRTHMPTMPRNNQPATYRFEFNSEFLLLDLCWLDFAFLQLRLPPDDRRASEHERARSRVPHQASAAANVGELELDS